MREYVGYRQRLEAIVERIRATGGPDTLPNATVSALGQYLEECEQQLITLMNGQQPAPNAPGNVEFGLMLYLLDQVGLGTTLGLPPTQITLLLLLEWMLMLRYGPGVTADDGTLIGLNTYEQLDPGWFEAVLDYIDTFLNKTPKFSPFPTNPNRITATGTGTTTIALFGDWGTGSWLDGAFECPAVLVANQIKSLTPAPDYTIHLGDVYYAGTTAEETANLIDLWPGQCNTSFTLNSNHEMYTGANGYFGTALASKNFASQQGTSYFSIAGPTWVIIGLDSAYYDTSLMYMDGALTDQNQIDFIKATDIAGKTVIILTHHTGLTTDGSAATGLWNNVCGALGKAPDYWYWGHVHNGIVYSETSAAGSATKARCIGHAALPFGNAYALENNDNVTYYTHTPLAKPDMQQGKRVLNGFAVLTINNGDGAITETFYDQTGAVAWSSPTP